MKKNERETYPLKATLGRLLKNLTEQDGALYVYWVFYTLAAGLYPLVSVVMTRLVMSLLSGPQAALAPLLWTVGLCFAASALLGFAQVYLKGATYTRLTYLRLDYIKQSCRKLVRMDYKNVEDASFGNRYERALEATSSNSNGIESVYHELFETPAEALTALLLILLVGMKSIWVLLALAVHAAVAIWIGRRTHAFRHGLHAQIGRANRRRSYYRNTTHNFAFGKDIRIYSLKERIMDNYRTEIGAYVALFRRIASREFMVGLLGLLTLLASDIAVYGTLIRDTARGMPIADFSMYLSACVLLSATLKGAARRVATIINEGQYAHDFFAFLDLDLGDKEKGGASAARETLRIEFKDVGFCYPNTERYVFRHLNLTIEPGERLAIVGVNGAGKTTLVKLLCGLFDVTEGEIRINGVPLGAYERKALWSMFSAVFQDVHVLAYTLMENVSCRKDGDRERARDALARAGLEEKIASLPKGLDQPMLKIIAPDGTEFSGGESQKLAIARALYKDANMVIMDEPTAALDALAEAEIYAHFSDLVAGKTAIYISHRLASTKFCDHIAFFDADGLKECGTHEELMALGGQYHHMFTVQGKYYQEGVTA